MTLTLDLSTIINAIQTLAVVLALSATIWSNRKLAKSLRSNALQQMIAEMNRLREQRMEHPDIERSLFPKRAQWPDQRIRENIMAVELANIFEWAYLARREGLIEKAVWDSWAMTWRSIIFPSPILRGLFADQAHIWTFCRAPEMAHQLRLIVESETAEIPDPISLAKR
jgi:hypothetical protein